jgi:hypothetical protein
MDIVVDTDALGAVSMVGVCCVAPCLCPLLLLKNTTTVTCSGC